MSAADPKILDIIGVAKDTPYVSLEYFPPRTEEGVKNLYSRMDRMKSILNPSFTDVTWGAGGSTADLSLEIAFEARKRGHVANLHMTCTNIKGQDDPKKAIEEALKSAHDGGIRNLVALRGDPPAGETEWKAVEGGFSCALDLVKFLRTLDFGKDFCVAVAGYPEGHPNAITPVADVSTLTPSELARSSSFDGETYACLDADYQKELAYLKEKIDAGGDYIITQMFFDAAVFIQFVKDCRAIGINCPIVPGIMCINNYGGFVKMTKFCKTRVTPEVRDKMESLKDQPDAVKEYGMDFGAELCGALMKADIGLIDLHFYTLNLEKVVYGVLDRLGLSENALAKASEKDAASMQAKGSAWARVGDPVTTPYGKGVVLEMDAATAKAKIQFTDWTLADNQKPVAYLQKGQYQKQL